MVGNISNVNSVFSNVSRIKVQIRYTATIDQSLQSSGSVKKTCINSRIVEMEILPPYVQRRRMEEWDYAAGGECVACATCGSYSCGAKAVAENATNFASRLPSFHLSINSQLSQPPPSRRPNFYIFSPHTCNLYHNGFKTGAQRGRRIQLLPFLSEPPSEKWRYCTDIRPRGLLFCTWRGRCIHCTNSRCNLHHVVIPQADSHTRSTGPPPSSASLAESPASNPSH